MSLPKHNWSERMKAVALDVIVFFFQAPTVNCFL